MRSIVVGDRRGLLLALQVFVAHEDAVACSLRQTQSPLHLLVISVKLRLGFPVDPVTEGAQPSWHGGHRLDVGAPAD